MYSEAFCRVYNLLGWNYFPEAFAEQLLRWLEDRGAQVGSALDLACGTGVLCQALLARGIRPVGVDLSEGMIAVARERCPEIDFRVGDMTRFRSEERFDLVTCTGDALNHLLEESALAAALRCASDALRPGGLLVFDLLGEGEVPSEEPFRLDFSERVSATFQVRRAPGGLVRLVTEVYEDGAFSLREEILERFYPPDRVCDLLAGLGLRVLSCGHRLPGVGEEAAAWYITAEKSTF